MRTTIVRVQNMRDEQVRVLAGLIAEIPPPIDRGLLWFKQDTRLLVSHGFAHDVSQSQGKTGVNGETIWYGYFPRQLVYIQWREEFVDTVSERMNRMTATAIPYSESWEVIFFGSSKGESEFLDHLITANGGVWGLEVLSVRNRIVARRLRFGKDDEDGRPRRERYFEAE